MTSEEAALAAGMSQPVDGPGAVARYINSERWPILAGMPPKLPLPQWIPPQLSQLVEKTPSGGAMAPRNQARRFPHSSAHRARRGKLLTRTGLDWTARYPGMSTALAAVRAKTAYLDGELCGIDADGLPSFAET